MNRFVHHAWAASALLLVACGVDAVGTGNGNGDDSSPGNGAPASPGAGPAPGASSGAPSGGANDPGGSVGVGSSGTPTTPAPAAPASCAEVPAVKSAAATLYVGHDPTKPWDAYCGKNGETYLPLPKGGFANWSVYPSGGCAQGIGVSWLKTGWSRVRVDPATFVVTTNDFDGADSFGQTHEQSGNGTINLDYKAMPFGTGRTCDSDDQRTVARIDLSDTAFRVAQNLTFKIEGTNAEGEDSRSSSGRVIELKVKGFPAGIHPCAAGDYYQRNGGACLQLEYVGK